MNPSEKNSWNHYPMGPKLRQWLGISKSEYSGFKTDVVVAELKTDFVDYLLAYMKDHQVTDEKSMVDLMDELLGMDLSILVLKLVDLNLQQWSRRDFRGLYIEGLAAMYCGELSRAELCFFDAHKLHPSEPAPYVNVVQIMHHDKRWEESVAWIKAGLKACPNHFPLWELFYTYLSEAEQDHVAELWARADDLHSWAGKSLVADLDEQSNQQSKASYLEPFYQSGEREATFLVEYTGALGVAGDYDRIPPIVWEAEKSFSNIPWKLKAHAAQAHLAMDQKEAFRRQADSLLADREFPSQHRQELKDLIKESLES
ncbi:MAG: hypothetical protein AB8G05_15390 [Oligoflexales bacterium]